MRHCSKGLLCSLLSLLLVISLYSDAICQQGTTGSQGRGLGNFSRGMPASTAQSPAEQGADRTTIERSQSSTSPLSGYSQRRISPPGAATITDNVTMLSLQQAIRISIENNLETLLAREREREARGLRLEALSQLLPNIFASVYQANQTLNLAALGLTAIDRPGTPTFIGPFNTFDARVSMVQSIFNLSAIRSYRAARIGVSISKYEEQLAREQVATFTSLAYLEALRTQQHVKDVQANLDLARSLLKLAQDQHDAGIATGIDVARAQTRVSEELTRLFQAQTEEAQARLQLQRIVGLPQDKDLTLTDPLHFVPEALPEVGAAIDMAKANRYELRIAEQQLLQRDYEMKAISAEQLPSLVFDGDYGLSGVRPFEKDRPTRRYELRLNIPIFNGGLTRGRIATAASQKRQLELQMNETRGQIEEDVRLALQTSVTTLQQVQTAMETYSLAEKELQLAQDRFVEGVADNIEVINAQTVIANARDSLATALASYNAARINLAASVGQAETFRW